MFPKAPQHHSEDLDALRKDAERYRYLRNKSSKVAQEVYTVAWFNYTSEDMDRMLDEAMQQERDGLFDAS